MLAVRRSVNCILALCCVLALYCVVSVVLRLSVALYSSVVFSVVFLQASTPLSAVRALSGSCLLYTSPSPRNLSTSRMPSSA